MSIIKRRKNDSYKKVDKNKRPEAEQPRESEPILKPQEPEKEEKAAAGEKGIGREAMILFRRSMYSSKLIGTAEDLIPFAWRQPLKLSNKKKMSRVFKAIATEQVEREMRMPVKQDS